MNKSPTLQTPEKPRNRVREFFNNITHPARTLATWLIKHEMREDEEMAPLVREAARARVGVNLADLLAGVRQGDVGFRDVVRQINAGEDAMSLYERTAIIPRDWPQDSDIWVYATYDGQSGVHQDIDPPIPASQFFTGERPSGPQ